MANNNRTRHFPTGPMKSPPHPKVLKRIARELRSSRAASSYDVRLASAMGLVTADSNRPLGYNDGIFYPIFSPPEMTRARLARTTSRLALETAKPRKLHALALLVDFKDQKGVRPPAEFHDILFDPTDPWSMTSYYRTVSHGLLDVTGEVTSYIRAPHPYTYYTNGQSGTGNTYPQNTPGLLQDVLTKFCQQDNLKRFDADGDGYVDGIFLIHSGGGAEAEPDEQERKNMIWSHKWTLPVPFVNDGVSVFAYSTEPEDGQVGVFAHEFGHVLGLPDLYDITYRSGGIGDWCLMSGGSWGGGGSKPCRLNCWCLATLGWIKPSVIRKQRDLKIPTLETNHRACYRLWTGGQSGPEYFLLENRQKQGLDVSLPGSGLAVWHVDETRSGNTTPGRYRVALGQADGQQDLEFMRNAGDDGDLFPGSKKVRTLNDRTTPSTRANNHSPTGVAVSKIRESAGVVTATVKV